MSKTGKKKQFSASTVRRVLRLLSAYRGLLTLSLICAAV